MNRDRIVASLEETSIACGCDDTGCNRQPVFWGDVASDAALDALAPTVEALIREEVREALTKAMGILVDLASDPPHLAAECTEACLALEEAASLIRAYRDEHYPEGES